MNATLDPAGYRAIQRFDDALGIRVLDQRALPHRQEHVDILDVATAAHSIADMLIRGAPLIGAVGAYGLAMAVSRDATDAAIDDAHAMLYATRPTAVNLRWALDRVREAILPLPQPLRAEAAWREANAIASEDVAINHAIGVHGLGLLRDLHRHLGRPLNVMTHCNAGALATCGWGTATAPIFLAHAEGIPVHVFVSETRPRLQGANLTAWEMRQRGIAHTLFVDSASGLLMRRGDVDLVIVGADRVASNGDVCNKIGTYDKALAAYDNGVPFYVGLPSPTIDWSLTSGDEIPIESRGDSEVLTVMGCDADGCAVGATIAPIGTRAVNYAFDVTPSRLVTGLITERGIARDAQSLSAMFGSRLA